MTAIIIVNSYLVYKFLNFVFAIQPISYELPLTAVNLRPEMQCTASDFASNTCHMRMALFEI